MNERLQQHDNIKDPLGLRNLPPLDPPADGWAGIEAALRADAAPRRTRRRTAWLAAAACAVLAIAVGIRTPAPGPKNMESPAVATNASPAASDGQEQTLKQLIAMSQTLEQQLQGLRTGSGPIPAASAIYVAEIEDLVVQVDNQISVSPDSINLWGQRVNLLLDLAQIYQHQWEREYGRMASL